MVDAVSKVKQYDFDGKLVRDIELPGVGTAWCSLAEKRCRNHYIISFTNYITPGSIYSFKPKTGEIRTVQKTSN